MSLLLLLDTNIVSILFKPDHILHQPCRALARGHQWFMSFMSRGELLLWPRLNQWGPARRRQLELHIAMWAEIMAESREMGRPITAADAWIAAAARQWDLPLVTADFRDFEHIDRLTLVPIPQKD